MRCYAPSPRWKRASTFRCASSSFEKIAPTTAVYSKVCNCARARHPSLPGYRTLPQRKMPSYAYHAWQLLLPGIGLLRQAPDGIATLTNFDIFTAESTIHKHQYSLSTAVACGRLSKGLVRSGYNSTANYVASVCNECRQGRNGKESRFKGNKPAVGVACT